MPSKAQLNRWKKKLAAAKVKVSEEDHGSQQSIYFEDPNGVMLEITAPASATAAPTNTEASKTIAAWVRQHSS